MSRQRTMTVLVDELAIEDGAIPPPAVGAVASFPLLFCEASSSDPDVMTIRARLDPSPRPPMWRRAGRRTTERWQWSGLLRGDGWTATWHGTRPMTGDVEMIGQFHGVMGIDASGSVRGRVTRVQIVSLYLTRTTDHPNSWDLLPGSTRTYREVEKAPRFFNDERREDSEEAVRRVEIGVLIDLDLDDVPEKPLRPRLLAADVSTSGRNVWVLDNTLPVVVHTGESRTAAEYLIPGDVRPSRKVWATPSGCWISGPDGTYRVTVGESSRKIDEHLSTAGAVLGETFLACTFQSPWQIHQPGRDPVQLDVPGGAAVTAIADENTFVVAARFRDEENMQRFRLIRVSLTGELDIGPPLPSSDDHDDPSLVGSPLSVLQGDTVLRIGSDLSVRATTRLPRRLLRAGSVGEHIWALGHPPTGTRWWPLDGPTEYDRSRGQFWLLTLIDATSLEPVSSAPIPSSSPSLAADSDGTIWVTADGDLHTLSDANMQWPNLFDVNSLLNADD